MKFLLHNGIVSCCPRNCQYTINTRYEVSINCRGKGQTNLPVCLPYHHVSLDYSDNHLTDLKFQCGQKNIRVLDVSRNMIHTIDGPSFHKIYNLTILNLEGNQLRSLPRKMIKLKATRIYIGGNQFHCHSCDLVNVLSTITDVTPQNLTCHDSQDFCEAEMICRVIHTTIPAVTH